jgi:two-component system sensor histidine kinase FlrB
LHRHTGEDREQEFCKVSAGCKRWLSVHDRRSFYGDELELFGRRQTILILRDITLHKQAEEQRESARKATALAEIATTLAHEIRNPLASLELFAGLIARGGDDVTEYIAHLHAGIRSLSGTVNNVLSFHGVGFPALVSLDLAAAIKSSVDFARPIAEQAGIELVFHDAAPEVRIFGNSSALQQVVLNMVSNAIRHSPAGGEICVRVREALSLQAPHTRFAVVEFSDKGCGISPEDMKHIFRAGFSVSGSTSGLGLTVCAQIVKQHDGEIRVESTPGAGTTFYVEIPAL